MFKVEMSFDFGDVWYPYGTYADRNKANEVAMVVRNERNCWVQVVEV